MLATALAVALMAVLVPPSAHARDKKGQDSGQSDDAKKEHFRRRRARRPSRRSGSSLRPTIEKLFKAYEQKDAAKAVPLADEVIANPKGNAYEHALAARIAAVTLLNTDNDKARPPRAGGRLRRAQQQRALRVDEPAGANGPHRQAIRQEPGDDRSLPGRNPHAGRGLARDQGNDLYRLKRYPEAIAALKAAVDGTPQPKPEWLNLLMASYFDAGQPQEATKVAEALIASNPDDKAPAIEPRVQLHGGGAGGQRRRPAGKAARGGKLDQPEDYRNLYAMYLNHNKNKEGIAVIQEGLQKGC